MKKNGFYISLFVIVSLGLVILILFGPSQEEDKTKSYLWSQNWNKIQYKQQIIPDDKTSQAESEIIFYRENKLDQDLFFVEAPKSKNHFHPQKRRANHIVKNIFSDWRKPEQKGFYKNDPEKRKIADLDHPTAELFLFTGSDTPDVKISIGKKMANGNDLVLISEKGETPVLAVIASHYLEKFRYELEYYRNKTIMYLAAGEFIQELDIHSSDAMDQNFRLIRDKQENPLESSWEMLAPQAKILEESRVLPTLGLIKQIQIQYFSDNKALEQYQIQELWKNQKKTYLQLNIISSKNAKKSITIKKPEQNVSFESKNLVMIKSSEDDFINWAEERLFLDITHKLHQLKIAPPKVQKTEMETQNQPNNGHKH